MGGFITRRWPWLIAGSAVLLLVTGSFWERVRGFSDHYGNVASVGGLLVSVVGFVLTLWAVAETQRIEREARRKIEDAIAEAHEETKAAVAEVREQTRQAIEKIGLHLLVSEVEALQRLIIDLRQAGRDGPWERALFQCNEARAVALRATGNPHLLEDEKSYLREAVDDLRLTIRYIEEHRLPAPSVRGLPNKNTKALDDMIAAIGRVQARLRRQSLESPHA
jgi:hypothetical protein